MPFAGHSTAVAVVRHALLLFVPVAFALGLLGYFLFDYSVSKNISEIGYETRHALKFAEQRKNAELSPILADILYLTRAKSLQRYLAAGTPAARKALGEDYLSLLATKKIYDQVRFIGMDGREIARADLNGGKPSIKSNAQLQDKSGRYYFRETVKLAAGEIYVSPFDLNSENGAIELPRKPTIRLGTPVFDSEGQKRGIVIVNFLGDRLLDALSMVGESMPGDFWLLNADGYWLLGRPADQWAFMYPALMKRTFARAFPEAWGKIVDNPPAGQFLSNGDLFTYASVSLLPQSGSASADFRKWILLGRVPASTIDQINADLKNKFLGGGAVIFFVLALISVVAGSHRRSRILAESRLRESEFRLRSYLDSSADSVIVTDADGRIEFANSRVENMFGISNQKLIGQPVEILIPRRFAESHVADRTKFFESPGIGLMGADRGVIQGVRADGTEFPVTIRLGFTDIDGRRVAIATVTDLSAIHERDDAIKELEAFSYSVSHDLRAPLRSMDGFSQVLLEDYGDQLDDQGRDYLGRVRRSAQNMGSLIDDMLTLSRITRDELNREEINLSELALDIVEKIREENPDRKIEFVVAEGLVTEGDSHMIRIALENLLSNACKFSSQRAPARIVIGHEQVGGAMPFYVSDNGVGFDMKYIDKLFVPFQRLHDSRVFSGTGIGLAIVKRVVSKHGGQVWAVAEPDVGAKFYFTLSDGGKHE